MLPSPRIYVPDTPIPLNTLASCDDLLTSLKESKRKSIAYFDENVDIFIVLPIGKDTKGLLNLDILYKSDRLQHPTDQKSNRRNISRTLNNTADYSNDDLQIWKFTFSIIPGRNYNNIQLIATYEKESSKKNDLLRPFEEVNMIQVAGVGLLNNECILDDPDSPIDENGNNKNISTSSVTINISALYKMALKSYKTEKTLAWLDLSSSKSINTSETTVCINSIGIECIDCDILSCTPIIFPIMLNKNTQLTMAYHVSCDDEVAIKPLTIIIDAILDGHKQVTTKWTSNLDLSSYGTPSNYTSSNINFPIPLPSPNNSNNNNNKKFNQQQALLPPVKMAKLRSYASLNNSKSQPSRLSSSSITLSPSTRQQTNSTVTGNSGLGGKRYTSLKFRSGSNLSLSQLWSGNTTQTFQRGLVITVTGPTRVKLGEIFRWKIQLLNKSTEKMDLILYVQSSIKKEYEKTIPPIPMQTANVNTNDIVPLFTNNQLVRSFYGKFNRAGLVSLTNNLRVSLEYGNLYECELELMSVERGMFNIYDFKVLDIASGDIFECNRLLDVMVI